MFFLLTATSLTLYASSLQLFFSSSLMAGIATLVGGLLVTLSQMFSHNQKEHAQDQKKTKTMKGAKKVCGVLDYFPDCNCDCPDCGGCDC